MGALAAEYPAGCQECNRLRAVWYAQAPTLTKLDSEGHVTNRGMIQIERSQPEYIKALSAYTAHRAVCAVAKAQWKYFDQLTKEQRRGSNNGSTKSIDAG